MPGHDASPAPSTPINGNQLNKLLQNEPVFLNDVSVEGHNPFLGLKRAPRRLRREASELDEVEIKYNQVTIAGFRSKDPIVPHPFPLVMGRSIQKLKNIFSL